MFHFGGYGQTRIPVHFSTHVLQFVTFSPLNTEVMFMMGEETQCIDGV